MAAPRTLTLADGQLGTTAANILSGADVPPASGRVSAVFSNLGAAVQDVVLTFQRAGGTARQIVRAELDEDETLLVRGLAIQGDDTLLGVATGEAAVDYLVTTAPGDADFSVQVLTADGTPKLGGDITVSVPERAGLTADGIEISGLLAQVRDLLLRIA